MKRRPPRRLPRFRTEVLGSAIPCLFFLLGMSAAFAEETEDIDFSDAEARVLRDLKVIDVPEVVGESTLDGVLDEPFWTNATQLAITFETYPAFLEDAPVRTRVWIIRVNDDALVGFRAEDPDPENIQAPLRDRDGIERDDYVGFSFDPEGKRLRTYEFYVSASGVQADWIRNRVDDTRSRDWDADWESAAKVGPHGYTVEMRIPLSEMDISMSEGLKRIMMFKRHYPRGVRRHLGAFAIIESDPEGTRKIERTLKLVPSATFLTEQTRDPATDDGWTTDDLSELSLDLEYRFTTSFGLLATLNPNYLEVEADLTEVSINDPFTSLIPEKRPFFTKGLETFGTPFDLVYTRTIDDPRVGVKAVGSHQDLTTGNFLVDDRELSLIVPGNLGSKRETLDLESYSGAFRYRYDIREGLTAGAISTVRTGDSDYHNVVAGADLYAKLGRWDELRAQWLYSDSAYPEELVDELCAGDACEDPAEDSGVPGETAFSEQVLRAVPSEDYIDGAWQAIFKHRQREGYLTARFQDVGEDFRADLGYLPRVDYRSGMVNAGLDKYFEVSDEGVSRARLSGNLLRMESQAGERILDSRELWLNYWGILQSWIRVGYRDRDRVAKRFLQNTLAIRGNAPRFNEKQWMVRFESSPWRNGRLSLAGRFGDQIDTDNYRLGEIIEFEPQLAWNVAQRYELSLQNTYRQLEIDEGDVFKENFLAVNLTYQLQRGSFIRFTFIDDVLDRDPDLYEFEEVESIGRDTSAELLFAWKPTQRNVFFIGGKINATDADELDRPRLNENLVYIKYARAFDL